MPRMSSPAELEDLRRNILSKRDDSRPSIAVCGGTGCVGHGNHDLINAIEIEIEKQGLSGKVDVKSTGCRGLCEEGPLVAVFPEEICYTHVAVEDAAEIVSQTVVEKTVIERLLCTDPSTGEKYVHESEIPFYKNQTRVTIADNGSIDPRSIDDYLATGGYSALTRALQEMSPEQVVAEVKKSNLRGRSGGGFPAGSKWEACARAEGETKYIICNCHEGDPGAFADRRVLESSPHRILEGMIIGAYAMNATDGYIFIGNEFPLTIENTEVAIAQAEEHGLLGENILGSGLNFTVKINIDGGIYVCGETSALMASMEGRVGEPVTKYDHATERGLWQKPTDINNLQTWANIPQIISRGADWHNSIGTERSKGTMVFSISGAVNNTGLIEVPMGTTLRQIIFDIGGGIRNGKKFKAVLVGGPMGGFVPEDMLDLPVDFDELKKAVGTMGPSLIVLDESACMVDMAKYFLTFLSDESCGKCTPCREGIRQMIGILNGISEGRGAMSDLDLLELVASVQRQASLCGLGQLASNPLSSTLKSFRSEYDAHISEKRCPAGVCRIPAATPS